MSPANEYVEQFVKGVDFSKVFTAKHVMKRAESITLGKDGLRVALKSMKSRGLSSIYVVDRDHKLVGAITADKASLAIQSGSENLQEFMETALIKSQPDTPLHELFEQASTAAIPVAVVDERDRLRGVIVRGAILAALSGNEVKSD